MAKRKKPYFSEREVRLARSFLKAIHGNETNGYLLMAVIAWQRGMTKSHDTFWKTLTKYNAFRAGQLLAAKLIRRSQFSPKDYKGIVAALRRGGKSAASTVDQARDFLTAITQSKWDRDHYGYRPYVEGHWVADFIPTYPYTQQRWVPEQQEYDPLVILWAKLTGHNIPKQYFIDKVVMTPTSKPKPEPPRQPRSLIHVQPEPDYIQPYAARTFYDSRPHLGSNMLTGDW